MPALRTRDTQACPLEVTTDAPQPPTLAIISPTPRAFTFPLEHNLTDSPYSSPSNSPFEPDLRPLALSCITPPPLMRTLSPPTSLSPTSPAEPISTTSTTSTHKRRKSSASCDVERRPKKGDEDYIKRPENAFILFRRKCCEERQQAQEEAAAANDGNPKKQRQADLSKTISQQWKSLSAEERQYWEKLAKEKKKEHEQMYPNYVYRPQRSRDKDGRPKPRKSKTQHAEEGADGDSVSFVLPMVGRNHGRSVSAPTPPLPYQSIQIPNVYQMTPSCPTSPSLLPMISRRSAHPGHPEEVMSNFDYLPNDNFSFGQAGFEANLQSSEFLRSMFNLPQGRVDPSTLSPLDVSPTNLLLPAHQILSSPASSSGPSSPRSGPFTPTSTILSHSFSQLTATNSCTPTGGSPSDLELQMGLQLQLQQELEQLEYSSYAWGGGDDSASLWPAGSEILLGGDDFDLSAIPPIELGVPKYAEEMGSNHHAYAPPQEQPQYMGYDEMMSSGHGY